MTRTGLDTCSGIRRPLRTPDRNRGPPLNYPAVCCTGKTPEEFSKLLKAHEDSEPIYESPPGQVNQLRVYEDWSFFKVRGADQCLEHTESAKNTNVALRIEIFAPVLLDMLHAADALESAFNLDTSNIMVIILNPTSQPFSQMQSPTEELRLATSMAIAERSRAQGKLVDLADVLKRVSHLYGELDAWRGFLTEFPGNTLECLSWKHFEYRYSQDEGKELNNARKSLLTAARKQWPIHASALIKRLEAIM